MGIEVVAVSVMSSPLLKARGRFLSGFFAQELKEIRAVLFKQLFERDFPVEEQTALEIFHGGDGVKFEHESLAPDPLQS